MNIVIFGAGSIGQKTAKKILSENQLDGNMGGGNAI